jgi:outer membrane protein OmpA-like peptidoglycan-associated protein
MSRISVRSPDNWRAFDLWNLIVAILLALAVLWVWKSNNGLTAPGGCCAGGAVAAVAGASWSSDSKITFTGVIKDAAERKGIVDSAAAKYGVGNVVDQLTINRHAASKVVLTGTVPSEEEKKARSDWAASIYGSGVIIDNQIVVIPPTVLAPSVSKPPAVKVYFETAKSDIRGKDRDALGSIITYLKADAAARALISGFHDPRGDKASNEALAKNRAKTVRDVLRAAGVGEARIIMSKPQETIGSGDLAEARRVEVAVE